MGFDAVKLLEISVTFSPKNKILEEIRKGFIKNPKSKIQNPKIVQKPLVIFTPNPEQIVYAHKNPWFAKLLNQADVAIPDGTGLVWAINKSRIKNQKSRIKKISGVEFMEDLVKMAAEEGVTVGLIGGRSEVAVKALECLSRKYHGLKGWAMEGPEMEVKSEKLKMQSGEIHKYIVDLTNKINTNHTQIVFVGLGAPKQEILISNIKNKIININEIELKTENFKQKTINQELITNYSLILMSVGGAFDMISGRIPRAPAFMRFMGFEWLWRLVREPWRFRRQLALLEFVKLVLRGT